VLRAGGSGNSDLLIVGTGSWDILPSALRMLADARIALRAVKVHRPPGSGRLIEFRTERLEQLAIERIARRLCALSAVSRVVFRTGGGVAGWLVGHHTGAASQSEAPSGSSAPSEAA